MINFIKNLPKAELHIHIEGSLEPERKFKCAEKNGIELPYKTVEEVIESYNFKDLTSFLTGYYEGMSVLITEEDFYDMTMDYLKKAASENIRHTEIFFDPQAHTSRGVSFGTVIKGILKALEDGKKELHVSSKLIMCFLRDMSAESAMEALEQSLPYKESIVAVGLDSDERDNPPEKFSAVFAKAREIGYLTVAHCDVDQQDSVAHIYTCLDDLKVARLDHGINATEDPKLMKRLAESGMGLTVCPISNLGVTGSLKADEIRTMMTSGMCVTLSSDDPAYFKTYMNDNFEAVQKALNLTKEELCTLAANSFKSSFISDAEKKTYLDEINAYLAAN